MAMLRIRIKNLYARPLGDQIMYWRIRNCGLGSTELEWTVVDHGRNVGANLFREADPAAVAAMKKLQRPERRVAMNDVNGHLLEHFIEWGWVPAG